MRGLVHSSLLVTASRASGILLQGLIVIFLARSLPVAGMGVFALCYAILGFARLLGPLGTGQVTLRLASVSRIKKHNPALDIALNTSLVVVGLVNALIASLVMVAFHYGGHLLFPGQPVPDTAIALFAATIPAFAIISMFTAHLRGFGRVVIAQMPDSIALQLLFGAGLLGTFRVQGGLDLNSVFLSLAIASWSTVAIYAAIRFGDGANFRARPRWRAALLLLAEGKSVLWAMSVTALSSRAPLLLSAPLLGPAATGVFDIASRFGSLPTITTSSVDATFAPQFAAMGSRRNHHRRSAALSLSSVLALIPALLCLLAIIFGMPLALKTLLPAPYMHAYVPMVAVCLAASINAAFGPASTFLIMVRRSDVVGRYSLLQLGAICLLAPPLAYFFGLMGLAVTVFIGAIMRDFGLAAWVSSRFGITLPPFGIGRGRIGNGRIGRGRYGEYSNAASLIP